MTTANWKRRLLSYSLWVALGIFLGRLAGFVREASLAARFGASADADVAVVLLTLPDILVNLLMGGALSVALIPEFKRLGSGMRSQALFVQSSLLTGITFSVVAATAVFFSETLLSLVAPGLSGSSREEVLSLLSLALWAIPLTTLAGITTAYLQANERFMVPALGTFLYNGVLVLAILFFLDPSEPLRSLAFAILIGVSVRWVSQLLQLPRRPVTLRSMHWSLLHRALLIRYLQALGAGGLITLLPVIGRALASQEGEGYMAIFNYSHKLVEFPLGVSITVFAIVIFPLLSHAFARGEDALPPIRMTLHWVVIVSISLAVTLIIYSDLVARLIYGWGKMTPEAIAHIARLFSLGLVALPLQGVSSLLLAVFNARRDTGTPLRISVGAVFAFLPMAWLFGEWWGLEGIMLALVITYFIILLAQLVLLNRRHAIAVWGLLELGRLGGLFLAVGLVAVGAGQIRQLIGVDTAAQLIAGVTTGILLLFVSLLAMGERQTLIRWIMRRDS